MRILFICIAISCIPYATPAAVQTLRFGAAGDVRLSQGTIGTHQEGYGMNSLGRGATDRIRLDFGDDQISRNGHAVVTYDPRGRKFYVQHGGGTNLTYLGDQPVLAPAELSALSHISIGHTVLRFVPLCGADFDWQD